MSNIKYPPVDLNNPETIDYILKELKGLMNAGMYLPGYGKYNNKYLYGSRYYFPGIVLDTRKVTPTKDAVMRVEWRDLKCNSASDALEASKKIYAILLDRWDKHLAIAYALGLVSKKEVVSDPLPEPDESSDSSN